MPELSAEEIIREKITAALPGKAENILIQRPRRLWLETKRGNLLETLTVLSKNLGFDHLSTITGIDLGDELEFLYHLGGNQQTLTVRTKAPAADPEIESVTPLFTGAAAYERELVDMFGAKIKNLPPGNRYPLPDDFPADQHPLRKSWKPSDLSKKEQV